MTLPNVPTDSLYKFLALTGIIIVIFCFIYTKNKNEEIVVEIFDLQLELAKNSIEQKYHQPLIDDISQYLTVTASKTDSIGNVLDREKYFGDSLMSNVYNDSVMLTKNEVFKMQKYLLVREDYLNRLGKYLSDNGKFENIDSKMNELLQMVKNNEIRAAEGNWKLQLLDYKIESLENWEKVAEYCLIFGLILFCSGFIFWYAKVQKPLDKKLQQDTEIATKLNKRQRKNRYY